MINNEEEVMINNEEEDMINLIKDKQENINRKLTRDMSIHNEE
jgi:hypothetical protein